MKISGLIYLYISQVRHFTSTNGQSNNLNIYPDYLTNEYQSPFDLGDRTPCDAKLVDNTLEANQSPKYCNKYMRTSSCLFKYWCFNNNYITRAKNECSYSCCEQKFEWYGNYTDQAYNYEVCIEKDWRNRRIFYVFGDDKSCKLHNRKCSTRRYGRKAYCRSECVVVDKVDWPKYRDEDEYKQYLDISVDDMSETVSDDDMKYDHTFIQEQIVKPGLKRIEEERRRKSSSVKSSDDRRKNGGSTHEKRPRSDTKVVEDGSEDMPWVQ